jgi:hypothetical protein
MKNRLHKTQNENNYLDTSKNTLKNEQCLNI